MSRQDALDTYQRYRTGLSVNIAVVLIQAIVLFLATRSIGLFEDMMHGIGDNVFLVGTTIVLYFEAHGTSENKGRKRILALIGGALLVVAGIGGAWTAIERITGGQVPLSGWVLGGTTLIAIVGNGWAYRIISGANKNSQGHLHDANVAHLIGDLAISCAVLLSAIGIILFSLPAIDSWVVLVLIAPWMLWRGAQILRYKDPPDSDDRHKHPHHH